jgi:hypothetical protein
MVYAESFRPPFRVCPGTSDLIAKNRTRRFARADELVIRLEKFTTCVELCRDPTSLELKIIVSYEGVQIREAGLPTDSIIFFKGAQKNFGCLLCVLVYQEGV